MFSLTLKTIRAKKARFVLTAVAVMLGVAFMAGTLVLTDTIKQTYDDLAGQVYKDTDAVVRSASTVEADNVTTRGSIDAALLDQVRAVPSVAAAEPQVLGVALVVGPGGELLDSSRNRAIPIGMAWQTDDRINPMELVDGAAPAAANEIVIDRASADKGDFTVGDKISVIGQNGAAEYRLAGIATYAGKVDAAGAQVVAFTPATATQVLGTPGRYDAIDVVAAPGVSQTELTSDLQTAIANPDVDVISGAAAVAEARTASGSQLSFLNTFLMTFAIVALLVGSFVIYNTFSITVAQRTKETALLRAIGAKRKQVLRSVMFESIVTGLFASAIGVVAGIFTAKGIALAFTGLGFALPAGGTVVNSSTIVISMVVGTVVTVLAAYVPARRAAKVAPIAAMRDVSVDRTGTSVRRAVIGTVVTVVGAAFIAMGLSGGAIAPVGLGAVLVFVGVAVLGPVIARPFTKVLGAPLPRLRGMAGTVARENAARNPRRSAATASALMIGVGLVAFITVFAASTKASINASVDNSVRTDWVVETAWGMGGLSPEATKALDALPETDTVTPLRYAPVSIDGSGVDVTAFDPAQVAKAVDLQAIEGDLAQLGPNDLAVWQVSATNRGLELGDTVTMTFADSGEQTFTVRSIYDEQGPTNGYAISLAAFDANVASHVDNYVLIDATKGYSSEQVRHAMETTLDQYPNADVMTRDEYKGTVAAQIDQMLNLVYVLLFMALVIALFGIANTLALSVFERTREIGLLRAVGMSRSQLRASVRWESVLIAMLGTALGTAIGLGFGYAMVQALKDKGIGVLSIPTTQLGYVIVTAAFAAVLAAAVPAYRASRLDVLESVKGGTD
jgi:putative ABC transport system permease protein